MGVLEEPLRGAIGDLRVYQRPGRSSARRLMNGELPAPPVWRLFGLRLTEVGLGQVTMALPVNRWLTDAFGLYWAGIFALPADGALGGSLWTALPPGKGVLTSEINLSFVRPITPRTRNVVVRARMVHQGRQVGLSAAEIYDDEGRMLGYGTTRCLIVDVPVDPDAVLPVPDTGPDDPPDPWERPAPGAVVPPECWGIDPMEMLERVLAQEWGLPNWNRLLGSRWSFPERGRISVVFSASPWFSAGGPHLYGGVIAWMAEAAMGTAVYSSVEAGNLFATLDMNVRFARPASFDLGDLYVEAKVVHRGRRLRIATAEFLSASGKRVAMATSSALVVPDGVEAILAGRNPEEVLGTR